MQNGCNGKESDVQFMFLPTNVVRHRRLMCTEVDIQQTSIYEKCSP